MPDPSPPSTRASLERMAGLRHAAPPARRPEEWIADIAGDPEGVWRSSWLAACARHAVE